MLKFQCNILPLILDLDTGYNFFSLSLLSAVRVQCSTPLLRPDNEPSLPLSSLTHTAECSGTPGACMLILALDVPYYHTK
jgi:hypothetical protein